MDKLRCFLDIEDEWLIKSRILLLSGESPKSLLLRFVSFLGCSKLFSFPDPSTLWLFIDNHVIRSYGEEEKEGNCRMECRSNTNKYLLSTNDIADILLSALPNITPILQIEETEVQRG